MNDLKEVPFGKDLFKIETIELGLNKYDIKDVRQTS